MKRILNLNIPGKDLNVNKIYRTNKFFSQQEKNFFFPRNDPNVTDFCFFWGKKQTIYIYNGYHYRKWT